MSNMPLQLLTADEKIMELQQLLESRNLENDELKLQMESHDQGRGVSTSDSSNYLNSVQDIMWLLNQTANDVNRVSSQPELMANEIMKKLQQIN